MYIFIIIHIHYGQNLFFITLHFPLLFNFFSIKGFDKRLLKELTSLVTSIGITKKPNIISSIDSRRYAVWNGGSILADLNSFRESWVTKSEYDEVGAGIVHTKCYS